MTGNGVRQKFLDFFKGKDHAYVPSDLLVPADDPTLLFTGAGMNQFKEQFMGNNITYSRATTCQKCLRTGDLENVGKTPRHHTFFEMLGNFSFGDYFKKEAIVWAWEFMVKEMGFPEEKLWVSVYHDDQESYNIWLNEIKIPAGRIVKLGAKDNFWPADAPTKGPNGPCGPCSEIFYDWGRENGCGKKGCDPSCDCDRFLEIWNLVFTEFERKPDGELVPLPNKNIDTGMGLERIVSVIQGKKTNFGTDFFDLIIKQIKISLADGKDLKEPEINLIADHVRAAVFTVCDGVSPSNEKRGYVVRKLIRRAYLKGEFLKKPFLYEIVPVVAKVYKDTYPELYEKKEHIAAIIREEERRFIDTLNAALPVLEGMLEKDPGKLSGDSVFKLVDTYGMPVEVISTIAEGRDLDVDLARFEVLMDERKELSRKGSDIEGGFIFQPDLFSDVPVPGSSENIPLETEIVFIVKDGAQAECIKEGEKAEIIVSPQSEKFYAESGGQVGDTGTIKKGDNTLKVINTYKAGEKKVLKVFAETGDFNNGDNVVIELNYDSKKKTAMNHTATHLLQSALREVLGEHVKQSGSYVDGRRLRFDFTHMKKVQDRDLKKVEDLVNSWISEKIQVNKAVKTLEEAKEEGALSFFGEKYGDTVRVVDITGASKELCGGDHVNNTGEIGVVKIISESSVASGIRRIEAVTGENARLWVRSRIEGLLEGFISSAGDNAGTITKDVSGLSEVLDRSRSIVNGDAEIDNRVISEFDESIAPVFLKAKEYIANKNKKQQKAMAQETFVVVKEKIDELVSGEIELSGVNFIHELFEDVDAQLMRKAVAYAEKKIGTGVIVFGNTVGDKIQLSCAVTKDIAGDRLSAKALVSKISGAIGGGGGGNDNFAQAGGRNVDGFRDAIEQARKVITGDV